ncbi:11658_t:CDS:1 [Funneliformis geosporum]|uniref:11658_t:CDS:1 n=1 Tax=Funneliformis geosporum TaxID=1117311 RepID=A0A9W4SVS8_9GLOM|nr:11658_t:CDS:1 [Funneliformis geosporum]
MNDLLFYLTILALLYYFFYYQPSHKKLNTTNPPLTKPLTHSQFTQTEPFQIDNPELAELKIKNQTLETKLETNQQVYQSKINEQQTHITNLQGQLRELVTRPLKPTNSKTTQTDSATDLTKTLDTLIKDIQALNNEL